MVPPAGRETVAIMRAVMKDKKIKSILGIAALIGATILLLFSDVAAQRNGKITFGSTGNVYAMNPDGTERTKLASSAFLPVYSPDGSKIAFHRADRIYVMNADGSGQTLVTQVPAGLLNPRRISWSPDGLRLAFTCGGICTVNIDGSDLKIISDSRDDYDPDWSPDGSKIAFTSTRDGTNAEIYVMRANGDRPERLTNTLNHDEYPAWSPDGGKIAFTSVFFFGFVGFVHVMDADGQNDRILTGGSLFDKGAGRPAYFADWSPDGTKLTYSAFCCNLTGLADEYADVWVIYADGDSPRNLTNTPPFDAEFYASWGTNPSTSPVRTRFDFDGDGRADPAVFRPSDRTWYIDGSRAGSSTIQFGITSDQIAPADFDGDRKTDVAVFRDGVWYWLNSSNGSVGIRQFGISSDVAVPADYSGDGRADLGVFRSGIWYTLDLANENFRAVQFGEPEHRAVPGDFDGDLKTDLAVFGDGVWQILRSSDSRVRTYRTQFETDLPVAADFDGDGRDDIAVFRPTTGEWLVRRSADRTYQTTRWGIETDIPVPADYDGDGRADIAVFRSGDWYILQSATASPRYTSFGSPGDIPAVE